ncbi:MAG: hypothetical protein ACM3S4_04330 [Burkholderiales bacterium]
MNANDYIKKLAELVNDFSSAEIRYINKLEKTRGELEKCSGKLEKQANMKRVSEIIDERCTEMKIYNQSLQSYFDEFKNRFFLGSSNNQNQFFDSIVVNILLDRIPIMKDEIIKIKESTKQLTQIIGPIGISSKRLLEEFISTEDIINHILFIFEA